MGLYYVKGAQFSILASFLHGKTACAALIAVGFVFTAVENF